MIWNCRIRTIILACFMIIIVITVDGGKRDKSGNLPANWPAQWNTGVIPFVFDYYSSNLKRLINVVRTSLKLMEGKGCLTFVEENPITLAKQLNTTYLYYSYSGVREECCGIYFNSDIGRRLVLITPICQRPWEIVHTTLHAMGLTHESGARFPPAAVNAVLFPANCVKNGAGYANNTDRDNYSKVSENEGKENGTLCSNMQ